MSGCSPATGWPRPPLPRPAIGVSRRHLDSLLLDQAARAGAAIERGVTVKAIDALAARLQDGGAIETDALFLAERQARCPRPGAAGGRARRRSDASACASASLRRRRSTG